MGLGDGWGFRPPPPCSSSLGSPPASDPRGEVSSPAVLCPGPKMGLLYPQVHMSSAAPSFAPATLSLFTLGSSLPFLSPAVSPNPPAVSPCSPPPPSCALPHSSTPPTVGTVLSDFAFPFQSSAPCTSDTFDTWSRQHGGFQQCSVWIARLCRHSFGQNWCFLSSEDLLDRLCNLPHQGDAFNKAFVTEPDIYAMLAMLKLLSSAKDLPPYAISHKRKRSSWPDPPAEWHLSKLQRRNFRKRGHRARQSRKKHKRKKGWLAEEPVSN